MMPFRVLVVDDEPDHVEILQEFLSEQGYEVQGAGNASEAMKMLGRTQFDLLISDINMPGKKGFELVADARHKYPTLKTALITAYSVKEYFRLAKQYDIGNIIAKTTPFNFKELALLVHNILTEDVFGLERYIDGKIHQRTIHHSTEVEPVIHQVVDSIPDVSHKRKFRQSLGEILVNAVYYGAKSERGDQKSQWQLNVALSPDEEVIVSWGADREKNGVSVRDQKGRLSKKDILYWLDRNTTKDENGFSMGLFDEHGKGIFITRETIDRLIINTRRNETTEVIMLNYHEGLYDGYRPLWIHEF